VFLDTAPGRPLPPWSRDPTTELRPARLRREHAMASAAVPLLLPAVTIDGELYCDGGLRQLVPLSPAIHLGARALLAVSPRALPSAEPLAKEIARERAFASPTYLAGKAIDALLLDRLDEDVHRLEQMNAVLRAGTRRWGDGFTAELNAALGATSPDTLHPVRSAVVRASADIGELAASYVRSPHFRRRIDGASQRLLRWLAAAEESRETDLLSYLLFDGGFAAELIALGRADAAARHAELCALLADESPREGAFA
jgi:NTE family protein